VPCFEKAKKYLPLWARHGLQNRASRGPSTVKTDSIDAKFENGVLHLLLPKKEEVFEKSPIDIKVS